jgi:hypothetical protein
MTITELSNACAVQDEAHAQFSAQGGFPVPLGALGREIVARIEAGDKARGRADDMYKSAGLQLIEARARVPDFSVFLCDHRNGLSRSRAYELIAIAEGKADEVRLKNRTRDRRRREKAARVREPRTHGVSTKKPQPPKSQAQWALAEFRVGVDTDFAKMDDEAKRAAFAYVKSKVSVVSS